MKRSRPPFHDLSEHPLPGTVASRIKAMEETYRRSLVVQSDQTTNPLEAGDTARSASVPLLDRPEVPSFEDAKTAGKTPRNKWLHRLNIGKSSSKRRSELQIPRFQDSPGLTEKVEEELKRRSSEQTQPISLMGDAPVHPRPTLRVQIEPPPEQEEVHRASQICPSPLATPVFEYRPTFDRLSLAVCPRFVGADHNHTFTFGSRRNSATSYFGDTIASSQFGTPQQALVASSPLSGDLHISCSPARNGIAVIDHLNASSREREAANEVLDGDVTGRFSIFTYEEKIKVTNDRPKSDPSE